MSVAGLCEVFISGCVEAGKWQNQKEVELNSGVHKFSRNIGCYLKILGAGE